MGKEKGARKWIKKKGKGQKRKNIPLRLQPWESLIQQRKKMKTGLKGD